MGYSTEFIGVFKLDRPLNKEHQDYLMAFHDKRHVKWNVSEIEKIPDPIREAVNLPIGEYGEYFVADHFAYIRDHKAYSTQFVLDENNGVFGIFSLYCQWQPSQDGRYIEWDGTGKFYSYLGWLDILIDLFLEPWGYMLNGTVNWQGEDEEDFGTIVVTDNQIKDFEGVLKPPTMPDLEDSG
jgi:hypothetical protein